MLRIRNRNGWTASQQAGDEALEAIAIALGETLPKTRILNQKIDPCLRVYSLCLDWPDKTEVIIHLAKHFTDNGWGAIEGVIRQTVNSRNGWITYDGVTRQTTQSRIVHEIFFDFRSTKSNHNPSLTMPTATIVKDQVRDCPEALDLNENTCDCEMCQFARNRREKLCELLVSLSAEKRAMRESYGGPGHI